MAVRRNAVTHSQLACLVIYLIMRTGFTCFNEMTCGSSKVKIAIL